MFKSFAFSTSWFYAIELLLEDNEDLAMRLLKAIVDCGVTGEYDSGSSVIDAFMAIISPDILRFDDGSECLLEEEELDGLDDVADSGNYIDIEELLRQANMIMEGGAQQDGVGDQSGE